MYTLIGTARLNELDQQAWLAHVFDRIVETPQTRLDELLPRSWNAGRQRDVAAKAAALANRPAPAKRGLRRTIMNQDAAGLGKCR